jgi:hypothetical protein
MNENQSDDNKKTSVEERGSSNHLDKSVNQDEVNTE